MTQGRNISGGDGEDWANGGTDGAAAPVRPKRIGRRVLARFLPGSVAVLAAFTMPEFSVGAGDLAPHGGFGDPPQPASKQRQDRARIGQASVKPQLAGVRYAPILDLDRAEAASLTLPAVMASLPAGNRLGPDAVPANSAPVIEAVIPAFVPPPPAPVPAPVIAPLASRTEDRAELLTPASMPVDPVAAVAVVAEAAPVIVPAAMPAIRTAPSLPLDQSAAMAAPAAPVALVTPPPAARQAMPAARGMIDQVTPARIAAAQTSKPATAAPAMGAPAAAKAAVVAPAARVPVTALAPAARPAPTPTTSLSPSKAAALAVPRPNNPALAAPPASKPAMPDITARLITRVDGKTAGAVDFQQTPGGLKVRLGSIVEVLADRYDPAQLARIRTSAAGNQYLSLAELQAQGVPISYDPVYDEFNVGLTDTRPKAAHKVHIDQISTSYRGLEAPGMAQRPR